MLKPPFRPIAQLLGKVRDRWPRPVRYALGISCSQALLAVPAIAAEQIYLNYSVLERAIPIEDLETYAREGTLSDDLRAYARYFSAEQLEAFQSSLLVEADLGVVPISQFLYTPQGEALLTELGKVIRTGARQPGFSAIRAAVILAAADDEGLTLLNVLKKFPTPAIRVDLRRSAQLAREVFDEINQTDAAIALLQNQAQLAIQNDPAAGEASIFDWVSLGAEGPYAWERIPLNPAIADFPADLYLPQIRQAAPIVVLSHGLGGDRTTLAYLARHLASHGFAVAVVEHPGSSAEQITNLLAGRANQVIAPEELVQRPLEIQTLLDSLERQAAADPLLAARLNFQQVGILGQSLGAYTTLAIAGAAINRPQLESSCPPSFDSLNVSLLLQCLALQLPAQTPDLADERIKAAIAINPLGSAIFGKAGYRQIEIPLMLVSGSSDTVTPALAEQIRPFTWLMKPQRYLLLMQGGTHFSTLDDAVEGEGAIPVPETVIGPDPALAKRYMQAISLAFFKTYLAGESAYRPFLTPAYVSLLSRNALPLSLVESLTPEQLAQVEQ
ncbi:alpha/beta hydrolase [Almyronema epifaneia]|uniref:Alpha/beta hydrolase n=1 Tax=Almyronema epifaneia S1 TaxID=2991925 RepID=A0ABW6IJG3_9CYAN